MARIQNIILSLAFLGMSACGQNAGLPGETGIANNNGLHLNSVFGDSFSEDEDDGKPARIKNPSLADVMKAGPLGDRYLGRVDAPITIIEYASLTCPYCRKFHRTTFPVLKRQYIDTGKVRFILREFPIGRSSGAAWIATRCAPKSKYFRLFGEYLERQNLWVSQKVRHDAIFKVASKVGMTRKMFNKCQSNQSIIDGLNWVKQRGRQLGVFGTPTFFINGEMVPKIIPTDELRARLDGLLARSG